MQTEAASKPKEEDCPSKTGRTGLTCGECGKEFQKPLVATLSASDQIQKYYACPHCLTKIKDIKASGTKEEKKLLTSTVKTKKSSAKPENVAECDHFFGYLKNREKQVPIPEECLTCSRMVECLFHETKS